VLFKNLLLVCVLSSTLLSSSLLIAAEQGWIPPRTASGAPDLQGLWANVTQTPMERPPNLGTKGSYTADEAATAEAQFKEFDRLRGLPSDPDREPPPVGGINELASDLNFIPVLGSKIAEFYGEYRTSLIIDPPDGRFPFREDAMDIFDEWLAAGFGAYDGPEMRPVSERCIVAGPTIPHMTPLQGSHIQIVQNDDYVMIMNEYGNETRIVRLNGEHPTNGFNKWMGDSIGHFEDDTLVVHTMNFRPEQSMTPIVYIKSSELMEVTERFTMMSEHDLKYAYTASDPKIYTQSFTVEIPMERMPEGERFYEFACHEGNYAMRNIMAGARRQDLDKQQ
jgi:hypothetical protein|tara:strand:- start:1563 stop:2570 length:1008 start_codon:yes stop_codon:yes gene_type:complete